MSTVTTSPAPAGRFTTIAIWSLRVLLALAFGAAALSKLAGAPMMVAEFGKIGLGQWFRYVTGVTELTGVVLILWPRTSFFGALIMICVCAGAFVAQLGPLHGDIIHVILLGGLAALTAWLTRPVSR